MYDRIKINKIIIDIERSGTAGRKEIIRIYYINYKVVTK